MEDSHRPELADEEARFRALYTDVYSDVLRFVARRVHASHAEDVVAEVFLVVWRRLGETPSDPRAARAWTFGVARGVMLNACRGERRRGALDVRAASLSTSELATGAGDAERIAARLDLAKAWSRLTTTDQEALALTYWDDLTSAQAAIVLAISPVAFRLRLSRARRHLRRHLDLMERTSPPSHPVTEWSVS